jgi:hypothetical protein
MVKIKSFSGDYEKVYDLIRRSWQDDYIRKYSQSVQDFSPDFLKWNIERDGYDPDLILEGYIGDELVGFSANMPNKLNYDGKIINSVLSTFLSIDPKEKKKGIGKKFLKEKIYRMRKKNYDLNYFIQDEGHAIEKIVRKVASEMGEKIDNYLRFTFLTKPLDSSKIKKIEKLSILEKLILPLITNKSKNYASFKYYNHKETNLTEIYNIVNFSKQKNYLRSFFSKDDLKKQLEYKNVYTIYESNKEDYALLNYYNINLISAFDSEIKVKSTMIDFVDFKNYSFNQKSKFVKKFCDDQKSKGSALILLPTMPLYDLSPFYNNLFFSTGRYHNIRAFDFNNSIKKNINPEVILFR